jgi:uncharacterized protein with PQ loop repeat
MGFENLTLGFIYFLPLFLAYSLKKNANSVSIFMFWKFFNDIFFFWFKHNFEKKGLNYIEDQRGLCCPKEQIMKYSIGVIFFQIKYFLFHWKTFKM